jgi:hypothetical protein
MGYRRELALAVRGFSSVEVFALEIGWIDRKLAPSIQRLAGPILTRVAQAAMSPSYEAVIASGRAFQRGDHVSFYIRRRVDGEKKRGPLYKRAKLADPGDGVRDEDVEFYIEKLEEVAAQFDEFAPRN